MMLDYVGERAAAARIELAVARTLQAGHGLTKDLGGTGNTQTITDEIMKHLGH